MSELHFLVHRLNILKQLEKQYPDTKFIMYVSNTSVDYYDAVKFYNILRDWGPVEKIGLIIDSPGGDPDAAFKIVSLLRQHCNSLVSIVPFVAKSAATLIALGTDEIQMGPSSELGPIDPQIRIPNGGQGPAQAIRDCIDYIYDKIKNDDDPKLMSTIMYPIIDKLDPWLIGRFERSVKAAKQYAHSLLCTGMLKGQSEEDIEKLVQQLSEGYYSHGYVIDRNEAQQMGLNIKFIDNEYWDTIWDLYFSYHFEQVTSDGEFFYKVDTLESLEQDIQYELVDTQEIDLEDDVEDTDVANDTDDSDTCEETTDNE